MNRFNSKVAEEFINSHRKVYLTFDHVSIAGDSHSIRIAFKNRHEALKAQKYIAKRDPAVCGFVIDEYEPEPVHTFESWLEEFGDQVG